MQFRFMLMAVVMLFAPLQSVAQEPDRDNAATHYNKAFALLAELRESRPEDYKILTSYTYISANQLSPEMYSALQRINPILALLRKGASSEYVDFGIDYSPGPGTLLPHLGPMRWATQLLIADARIKMLSGDIHGAVQSLSAGYQMSDHVTDNPVIINTLVGASIFRLTNEMVQQMLGEGKLDMADARILFETVKGLANEDPLGFVASIDGERSAFSNWLLENYAGEDGKEKFLEEMPEWMGMEGDALYGQGITGMSQAEFTAAIHLQDLAYVHMSEAARMDDLDLMRKEMKRIQEDAQNGVYGPFSSILMPALDRYVEMLIDTYGSIDDALNDLATVATDPDGAAKVMNAAIWYLRAIGMANTLSGDFKARIDLLVDSPQEMKESKLNAGLPEAKEIIDILTEGSKIKRCNFDLRSSWENEGIYAKMTHLEGMKLCARILVAEMNALFSRNIDDDAKKAAENAATCMRMIAHLANDKRLACVDTSLDIFSAVNESLIKNKISVDNAGIIKKGLENIDNSKPFGFASAIAKYHKFTVGWFINREITDYEDKDRMVQGIVTLSNEVNGPQESEFKSLTYLEIVDGITELDIAINNIVSQFDNDEKIFSTAVSEATTQYEANYAKVFSNWFLRPLEQCAIKYEYALDERETLHLLLTDAIRK